MLRSGLFAALSLAMATPAFAEATQSGPTIVAPTGKVLVNQGNGFVPATNGLALSFKDQIMVGKDAAVTLAYAKCSVVLKQGTMLTLPKGDLCEKTAETVLNNSVVISPVSTGVVGGAGSNASIVGFGFAGAVGATALGNSILQPVSKP